MIRRNLIRTSTYGLAAVALFLSACSAGGESADPLQDSTPPDSTLVSEDAVPTVSVNQDIAEKLNIESGEAIIPGSLESNTVDSLDSECVEAVTGLRGLMGQYPSLRQVPPDGTYEAAFAEAKSVCEGNDPQQWTDFYTEELVGWIYAAVEDGVTTSPAEASGNSDENVDSNDGD